MIFAGMALQLVDSELPSTRLYWRKEVWGFSEEISEDLRPMREILGAWPNWRDAYRELEEGEKGK